MADDKSVSIVIKLKDIVTGQLKKVNAELKKFDSNLKKLAKGGFKLVTTAAKKFVGVIQAVGKALFSFKGVIAGIGLGALIKSFIDAASTAENLRVRLAVLTGSIAEGNRMFKEMAQLASQVPHTFEEIMEASTRLIGVVTGGVDQVKELMPLILDLSTATGLGVNDVTAQVIRMWSAGAAAADMFRERGVLAMLGFTAGAKYSVDETRRMLVGAWEAPTSKFRGAADALADTWTGLISMLQDAWFQFRVEVMESGVFRQMKAALKGVVETINRLKKEGKLKEWAQGISDSIVGFAKSIIMFVGNLYDTIANIIGSLMGAVVSVLDTINRLKDGLKGLKGVAKDAQEQIADDRLMTAAERKIRELNTELKELEKQYKAGKKSAEEFASGQADINRSLDEEKATIASLNSTRTLFTKKGEDEILTRERMIDSLRRYSATMSDSKTGYETAIKLIEAWDQKAEEFNQREEQRNKDQQARRANLKPEPFQFSADEKGVREATLGAAQLKQALVDLNQEYKSGQLDVETYFAKKTKLQEEQYSKELGVQLSALDQLEKNEVQRRRDIADEILRINQQIADGIVEKDDAVTQERIASLAAKYEADRGYLEQRRAISLELIKIDTKNQSQIFQDLNAQNAEKLRIEREYVDAKTQLRKEEIDRELRMTRLTMEGLDLLREEQLAKEDELKLQQEQEIQDKLDLVQQGYLSEVELKRIRDAQLEESEALHQANMRGYMEAEQKAKEEAAKREADLRRTQLQVTQTAAAGMAGAFKDMYDATGKQSKEFFYAWKAMQIATAIISTFSAANAAYENALKIQPGGDVMAPIAAALAVAQGMARVAMIRSQTLAEGGTVGGSSPTATADNIPAMLTAGEFVHPVSTVKHYGTQIMEAIRQKAIPKRVLSGFSAGGLAPAPSGHFATGGKVPSARKPEKESDTGDKEMSVVNVTDPELVEQHLSTKPGQQTFLNIIGQNAFQIKQILNQ